MKVGHRHMHKSVMHMIRAASAKDPELDAQRLPQELSLSPDISLEVRSTAVVSTSKFLQVP